MQSAAEAATGDELKYSSSASALSPPDSSLDDLDEYEDLDSSETAGAVKKPHFLDYDNKPPAGLEDQVVFVGQPRRRDNGRTTAPEEDRAVPEISAALSQSAVISDQQQSLGRVKDVSRGTWPTMGGQCSSSSSGSITGAVGRYSARQNQSMHNDSSEICPKMECVYSLLSMLGSTNSLEMSAKFMELSKNRESCSALRRSGCIPLLVQIIHNDPNETARRNARHALSNVICCHPDDKAGRREVKVLKLIEQLIDYSDLLRDYSEDSPPEVKDVIEDPDKHPIQSISTLMKISFDEEHRHAMCQLGALQTTSSLIQADHAVHGPNASAPKCITMRRYAGMILTNLTFGDGNNKSLLCSNKSFMRALVAQIQSSSDELVQITASVLRNLSWRADSVIKQTLNEIGTVKVLTQAAMGCTIENTLKAILSALWNLSNHCPSNRAEFCAVEGALEFLIDMLTYEAPSKTASVIENAGGILRNISSHVAAHEDYRKILRKKNCLKILLEQLQSSSLTVVSNACGTLGNLSADNYEDQKFLRDNGAIPMLRSLVYSKHKMISNGSSMALKNLRKSPALLLSCSSAASSSSSSVAMQQLGGGPPVAVVKPTANGLDSKEQLPCLNVRKKKAMEQELEEKFLPKGLREEKDICTSKVTPPDKQEEEAVSHNSVQIRLVADNQVQDDDSEKPVNYSLKEEEVYQDYQETDIDQITDYSLRYAENQSEDSDDEKGENYRRSNAANGILMPEDSVKCYYTEGTPQIISSATSMSDLRVQMGAAAAAATASAGAASGAVPLKETAVSKSVPIPIATNGQTAVVGVVTIGGGIGQDTGCNTPDKPFNYCEEGTPDFSRDASLSMLDMNGERSQKHVDKPREVEPSAEHQTTPATPGTHTKQVSFLNTAEETPLMFSRTSSIGSLSSAEPACTDDKSSIISEFSRFASGVISPSELPDSPTQSMPHSPRRSGMMAQAAKVQSVSKKDEMGPPPQPKSAFEDTVSKFNVENTPAAFSCATSLSNLTIDDKEDEESKLLPAEDPKGPPVLPIPEASASEDGESDADGGRDDDLLLESCISMGMNSVMARSAEQRKEAIMKHDETLPPPHEPEDHVQRFCTEDTPAQLSKAPSNCNLSVLSIDTRNGHESDESSNVSDQNDRLLEECIRSGMPKPKNSVVGGGSNVSAVGAVKKMNGIPAIMMKENPMNMMRNPAHEGPLYANDEINNFYVEDSPCAFSTVSELSDLTVPSEAAVPEAQKASDRISTLKGKQPIVGPIGAPLGNNSTANDSLSSLSVESDNDDNLLDEAIAAGIGFSTNKAKQNRFQQLQNPVPTVNRMTAAAADANDSLDSIDSVDSNDPQNNSLLEQAIENGMKNLTTKPRNQGFELRAGMNFAQIGLKVIPTPAPPPDESIPDSDRDYELLMECIQSGMPKVRNSQLTAELTQNLQRLAISGAASSNPAHVNHAQHSPKNVDTTPVVTKDAGATNVMSAGVVAAADTTAENSNFSTITTSMSGRATVPEQAGTDITTSTTLSSTIPTITSSSSIIISSRHSTIITRSERAPQYQQSPQRQLPLLHQQHIACPMQSQQRQPQQQQPPQPQPRQPQHQASSTTLVQNGFESALERSNEFPAGFGLSSDTATLMRLMSSSSVGCSSEMQVSNEFMVDQSGVCSEFTPQDKHKDPDLMLKSVERLTQELVSTAEYLRTVSSSGGNREDNNTWDEDATCANDVSFPSLSVQAPRIQHSYDDDDTGTISDEVDSKALDALEEQTPMNESKPLPGFNGSNEDLSKDEIHFQLGGEVKSQLIGGNTFGHPTDALSFSTVSTLTNSTIIAIEATKVANNLQNLAIVESADVDLSKIHPPFGSDSILISDCSDTELTFRNDSRKMTLPSGLVAKRALGQTFNDSLNALHNLDSIGPPSIMDELMDSMISVASITSEVVDVDSSHTETISAASDPNISSGNSSLTLHSSMENLIKFSPTVNAGIVATPTGKSTPMSPKRAERRQAMKDRYKTYTIPTTELADLSQRMEDTVAKEEAGKDEGSSLEVKTPTPSLPSTPSPKKSSKERRQENKSRYETQVINTSSLPVADIPNGEFSPRTPKASIIATPVAFSPITLQSPAPMSLERVLSPESVELDEEDVDPATYTIDQPPQRRLSFEQKLPTIPDQAAATLPSSPTKNRSPAASPSKMPTATKSVAKPVPQPVKAVRGAKKPAYVSPYRKTVVSAPALITRTPAGAAKKELVGGPLSTPKLKSQSSLVETKGRPQPLKARSSLGSAKRNSLELNGGSSSARSNSSGSSSCEVPKIRERQPSCGAIGVSKGKVAPLVESPLIRQGTFTKDEPTNPEVPVVTSAPSTPAKTLRKSGSMIPSSASSSRLTTIAKSRIVLQKSISMDASKTTPSTPTASTPSGDGTPLTSRYRLTSARTSLVDYKKSSTPSGRLSTPISSNSSTEQISNGASTPTSPSSLIPMRRKSGIALPKRTNLTMKSNPDVLKGKLEGVRNAFVRTAASAVKTGTR